MAEYNDVIKQFKRMCQYYNNRATQNDCPLYCKGHGCNISHCRMLAFDDKKFQNVVMTWAEAHKEPVYPTWLEWLEKMEIMVDINDRLNSYEQVMEVCGEPLYSIPTTKVFCPIPADIAEKLGLEPKEG